ncbi:DUF6300 family protein [Streptomyces viridosporus]|uniref:DUF6300 family protein n=1 Tax=Streptomyces viridosporus TaxID=67581 RepID=UPI003329C929
MSGVAPQDDEDGRPLHLEPCPPCDAGDVDRPAAGLFVQFFADDGARDDSRARETSHLWVERTKERMTAHGRRFSEMPPGPLLNERSPALRRGVAGVRAYGTATRSDPPRVLVCCARPVHAPVPPRQLRLGGRAARYRFGHRPLRLSTTHW